MSILVVCSNCSARLNAPDSAAGKRVKCPKCQTAMVVPAPLPPEPGFEVVEDAPARKPVVKPKVKTDVTVEEDEGEAKPQKKRVQATVEDDEPPRRKRQAAEEDEGDEDERPRKKGKPAAGNSTMTRNIIGGVVLLVLLGVAGYVFYDKFGKSDDNTAGNGNTNPPARPANPGQPGPGAGQGDEGERIRTMHVAIGELNRAMNETTAALNRISDNDTALAAGGELEASAEYLLKLNDQLKGFGKVTPAEAGQVPAPSGQAVAALVAATTKVSGLLERKEVTGRAADSLAKVVAGLGRAVEEVSKTVIAMWPEPPKG